MDFFGLDIGTYAIRIVKSSRKGGSFVLDNFAEVKNPLPIINWNDASHQQALIESIRKCLIESQVKTRNACLCLKENQAYTQIILFPHIPVKELDKAIAYEAEQFIPVPLDDVQLEYQILKEPPKGSLVEKMEILVVAAQKKAIKNLLYITEKAGIKPINIETEMLAASRILTNNKTDVVLIVSIGHSSSNLILIDKGQIKFVHGISTTGESLTKILANHLSMNQIQAEQYKIAYGMDHSILDGQVAKILEPIALILIKEINQTIEFMKKRYPQINIARIVLSGGTADLKGLATFIAQKISYEICVIDPFINFNKTTGFPKELESHSASYVTAVGLSIKEI